MEKEIYIVVFLEDGYYEGIEKVFDTKEEAVQYAEAEGYTLQDDMYSSLYGTTDYILEGAKTKRLVIEQEVVFIH